MGIGDTDALLSILCDPHVLPIGLLVLMYMTTKQIEELRIKWDERDNSKVDLKYIPLFSFSLVGRILLRVLFGLIVIYLTVSFIVFAYVPSVLFRSVNFVK